MGMWAAGVGPSGPTETITFSAALAAEEVLLGHPQSLTQGGPISSGPASALQNLKNFVRHSVWLSFANAHAHDFVDPSVLR